MPTEMNSGSILLVSLGIEAHEIANYFCQQHSDFAKAERVYLNTLAVYAVNYSLEYMGIKTDLDASDSWNPIMQGLLNCADLVIRDKGKLECCPVMLGEDFFEIPDDALLDRIGYVVVELNGDMSGSEILGFVEKIISKKLIFNTLCSLDNLPNYLNTINSRIAR